MTEQRVKRRYVRHKPRRNRPPVDWPTLQEQVRRRDMEQSAAKLRERLDPLTAANLAAQGEFPCVAWIIEGGPIVCGPARSWRLDHQKLEPRLGVKGEDRPENLVSLCIVHDERGMKGGYIWNTAHREELRDYLARVEGGS